MLSWHVPSLSMLWRNVAAVGVEMLWWRIVVGCLGRDHVHSEHTSSSSSHNADNHANDHEEYDYPEHNQENGPSCQGVFRATVVGITIVSTQAAYVAATVPTTGCWLVAAPIATIVAAGLVGIAAIG